MTSEATELTELVRIAGEAEGLLKRRGNHPGIGRSLIDRITAAGIKNIGGLDKLIFSDRYVARSRLGLRSLTETDRILAALARARKDMRQSS